MITRENLKQIVMLTYLTDDMLDELIPITELLQYDEKEYVFRQGDKADRYYSILQGKVLLEQRIGSGITISLSSIKQGYSIGWSAMLDGTEENYSTDAICAEPTQLLSFRAIKLKALFEYNYHMGYIMSQRLLHVVKKRYDVRTEQFIKAIKDHPDLGALF
ncbi:MAG: cyclic nucleotide-binding domain-containing protein [Thermodesulfobacteriota bacterium]